MSLSDEVAARIMGEIHTLTTRIDEQQIAVIESANIITAAASLIKRNSELAVKSAKAASDLAQRESMIHLEMKVSAVVSKTLNKLADATATKSSVRWIVAGVALCGVLSAIFGWIGYSAGVESGHAYGYAHARDEIAASSWANTPNGKLAYQLDKAGSIEYLASCNRPGWKKENGVCYTHPADGRHYGWILP